MDKEDGISQEAKKTEVGQTILTSHAMLLPWGLYAQEIGLVERLSQVLIVQRGRTVHRGKNWSSFWSPC